MKNILLLLSILIIGNVHAATTYYVSFSAGNDNNTTTQAKSPATPWKTLSKINSLMSAGTIVNGDKVLLKAGDTWYDTLQLSKGIILDSFGTGAQPVVTGFYTVTSWTSLGGGIYESEAMPTPPNVSMVTLNGLPVAMGRFPNADAANGGYLTYEAHGSGYIRDVSGKPATVTNATWAGATVLIRTSHFVIERSTISLINGDTIKYSPSTTTPTDTYGYFLENDINALDQLGEWFYNPSTKKIDVFFGSAGPTGFTVQVAAKNNLCEPRVNNTSISNITFTGGNQYCLYNNWGGVSGLTVNNCNFWYAGSAAFGLTGRAGLVITNCSFRYANNIGISISYHNDRPLLQNNLVRDIGQFPGMYWKDANIAIRYGNGICFIAQSWESPAYYGGTFLNNKVLNCGYMGIFAEGDSNTVKYNYVDTVCTVLDDGGGIYTGNSQAVVNKYEVIDSNQVFHALGNTFGTGSNTIKFGEGIYLDDNSINVKVRGNTSAHNADYGIYLHNARKNTIQNNTVIDNGRFQLAFQDDHIGSFAIDSNTITNNTFFSYNAAQAIMYLAKENDVTADFSTFATWNNNRYCAPFKLSAGAEQNIVQTNWFSHSQVNNYSLAAWKTFSSQDAATTATPIAVTDPTHIIFNVNSSQAVSKRLSFCAPLVGVDNTSFTNKAIVNPFQSVILLKP
jgi:parallel beta-helix repeat protein